MSGEHKNHDVPCPSRPSDPKRQDSHQTMLLLHVSSLTVPNKELVSMGPFPGEDDCTTQEVYILRRGQPSAVVAESSDSLSPSRVQRKEVARGIGPEFGVSLLRAIHYPSLYSNIARLSVDSPHGCRSTRTVPDCVSFADKLVDCTAFESDAHSSPRLSGRGLPTFDEPIHFICEKRRHFAWRVIPFGLVWSRSMDVCSLSLKQTTNHTDDHRLGM